MLKNLFINWKTTSAGAAMILTALVHLIFKIRAGQADESTWTTSLLGILTGIGLLAAGDSAVSATKVETAAVSAKVDVNTAAIATAVAAGDTAMLTKIATTPAEIPSIVPTKPG